MLMRHKENGLHDASGSEIEEMKKNGWEEYGYEAFYVDAEKKRNPKESVTIEPQQEAVKGKPGRKPKNHHLGGVHGNHTDQG